MGKLLDQLKNYLANATPEQLEEDRKLMEKYTIPNDTIYPSDDWREITQKNQEYIYKAIDEGFPVMFSGKSFDDIWYLTNPSPSIGTMAKSEGYYYFILPKNEYI